MDKFDDAYILLGGLEKAIEQVTANLPQDYLYSRVDNNGRCTMRVFQSAKTGKSVMRMERHKDGAVRFYGKNQVRLFYLSNWEFHGFDVVRKQLARDLRKQLFRNVGRDITDRVLMDYGSGYPRDKFHSDFDNAVKELFKRQYCLVSDNGEVKPLQNAGMNTAIDRIVRRHVLNDKVKPLLSTIGSHHLVGNNVTSNAEYDFIVRNLGVVPNLKSKHRMLWDLWVWHVNTLTDGNPGFPRCLDDAAFLKQVSDTFGLEDRQLPYLEAFDDGKVLWSNNNNLIQKVQLGLQAMVATGFAPGKTQTHQTVMSLTNHHRFFADASWKYGDPWLSWVHVLSAALASNSKDAYYYMMNRVGDCLRFHVENNIPWWMVNWEDYVSRTVEWEDKVAEKSKQEYEAALKVAKWTSLVGSTTNRNAVYEPVVDGPSLDVLGNNVRNGGLRSEWRGCVENIARIFAIKMDGADIGYVKLYKNMGKSMFVPHGIISAYSHPNCPSQRSVNRQAAKIAKMYNEAEERISRDLRLSGA